jgi:hypothetical protein
MAYDKDTFALIPCYPMSNRTIASPGSIGHPPHSSASPVELRLRVGPRALSGKKKEVRVKRVLKSVRPSCSKRESAWGK